MPKNKKELKKVVKFLAEKWIEQTGLNEKMDNALFYGLPLVINNKTGEISNEIPTLTPIRKR